MRRRRGSSSDLGTVVLDGTPLLGRRTGVGTYVGELLAALAAGVRSGRPGYEGLDLVASPVTGRRYRAPALPPEVGWRSRPLLPLPARTAHRLWSSTPVPPVQLYSGGADLYHATNFVLPPAPRTPGVVTVHDLAYLLHPGDVEAASLAYRRLVPRGLARARAVLTVSHAVRAEVLEVYGLDPHRVLVTPNGVDPAWSRATAPDDADRQRLDLPGRYVVFVGTLEPRKNLPWLVRAHRQARAEHGEQVPELVLCGGAGWGERADLEGTVRTGYLDADDLRRVVAGAAALVLPSRYEGFGLPVLEALSCGTPVVCSDLPVLREASGGNAVFVPLDDTDALAHALAALPEVSDADRAAMAAHAARHTWQACADATVAAYRQAVEG